MPERFTRSPHSFQITDHVTGEGFLNCLPLLRYEPESGILGRKRDHLLANAVEPESDQLQPLCNAATGRY